MLAVIVAAVLTSCGGGTSVGTDSVTRTPSTLRSALSEASVLVDAPSALGDGSPQVLLPGSCTTTDRAINVRASSGTIFVEFNLYLVGNRGSFPPVDLAGGATLRAGDAAFLTDDESVATVTSDGMKGTILSDSLLSYGSNRTVPGSISIAWTCGDTS